MGGDTNGTFVDGLQVSMHADTVIEHPEELSDEQLARVYLAVQGEAYDRKLTEQRMEELQ